MEHIYLDNNSTTRIDPKVLRSMELYMDLNYGNPSSNNYFGQLAKAAKVIQAALKYQIC